jgi:hypothetical protein
MPWYRSSPHHPFHSAGLATALGLFWGVGLLCAGVACSARSTSQSGVVLDLRARPLGIARWTKLPVGAQEVGSVSASCEKLERSSLSARMRLSMLDCSPSFLLRVLGMRAMEQGASALVGVSCAEVPKQVGASCVSSIECHATAAKPPTNSSRAGDRARATPSQGALPSATTELHSFVQINPAAEPQPKESGEMAREVPITPVSNRYWTSLRVEIETDVSRVEALKAVRLAATRLGADNYESPHCQRTLGKGWQCLTELSVLDSERSNSNER